MTDLKEFRSFRILVVDDEHVVREVIRTALERPGIYVVDAADGEQAISLLLRETFDLVIVDKNLPGITGLDVIRRAKAVDQNMGALMITAYASRESAEEAMAIGVDGYIEKPFGLSDLEQKVSDAIERRAKRLSIKNAQGKSQAVRQRRILICEPAEHNCHILARGVELLGHQPIILSRVADVIEALREKRADALICNLDLLSSDNATSCFLRSTLLVYPEIRFVAVAGERGLDGAVNAIHHGARKVIYQPLKDGLTVAKALEFFLGDASEALDEGSPSVLDKH